MKKLTIIQIAAIPLIMLTAFQVPALVIAQEEDVLAATVAPTKKVTPTEKPDQVEQSIQELKDKVESKVSELNSKTKTVAGTVKDIKDDFITIENNKGSYKVEIDPDLTTFYQINGASSSEIKQEDVEKGNYILVSGPEIGGSVTANAIYVDTPYIVKSGKIIEVNSDDYYIVVQTLEKDQYTLDIENRTSQQILDIKTLELSAAGFSKLKEGDNVHFVAEKSTDEGDMRYTATKTIVIPQEYFIK